MTDALEIKITSERLEDSPPEEAATFGQFEIRTPLQSLTDGYDSFIENYRSGPLVSGYPVAEWFAWNWWRLKYEPRTQSDSWARTHTMTMIGAGYVWPNLTIFSDGVRTVLVSRPSVRPDAKPFRYFGSNATVVPSTLFESALDAFLVLILGRLSARGINGTNLEHLWEDLRIERSEPGLARRRRLEALMGFDPDEADDATLERLIAESDQVGSAAIDEIAADSSVSEPEPLSLAGLMDVARVYGRRGSRRDRVQSIVGSDTRIDPAVPAWQVGARLAQSLRRQEHLNGHPISSERLAQLSGLSRDSIVADRKNSAQLSFVLDQPASSDFDVVLRSKWETGRRFEVARLLVDQFLSPDDKLHPATRALTYRQKAQRSFAAEFLAPFDVVDDMLDDDYSAEKQEEVANHFMVSEMTINSMLKNRGRLPRDEAHDIENAAA